MASDHIVGNKRPPKASQFKRGNPAIPPGGRAAAGTIAIIDGAMSERIYITEGGRRRSVTAREAIIRGLRNDALRGDAKARLTIIGLDMQAEAARGRRRRRASGHRSRCQSDGPAGRAYPRRPQEGKALRLPLLATRGEFLHGQGRSHLTPKGGRPMTLRFTSYLY